MGDEVRIRQLKRLERDALTNFKGQLDELNAELRKLRFGDHVGWKVLAVLVHNKRTIRKASYPCA